MKKWLSINIIISTVTNFMFLNTYSLCMYMLFVFCVIHRMQFKILITIKKTSMKNFKKKFNFLNIDTVTFI